MYKLLNIFKFFLFEIPLELDYIHCLLKLVWHWIFLVYESTFVAFYITLGICFKLLTEFSLLADSFRILQYQTRPWKAVVIWNETFIMIIFVGIITHKMLHKFCNFRDLLPNFRVKFPSIISKGHWTSSEFYLFLFVATKNKIYWKSSLTPQPLHHFQNPPKCMQTKPQTPVTLSPRSI